MLGDSILEEINSTKFLGIYLDQRLSWETHVNTLCSKIASNIFALNKLSKFCSMEVRLTAYYGLIQPHLCYGVSLWGACPKIFFDRVLNFKKERLEKF